MTDKPTKKELVIMLGAYTTARDRANKLKDDFVNELLKFAELDMVVSKTPSGLSYNLQHNVRCYGQSTIDMLVQQLELEVEFDNSMSREPS